VVILVNNWCDRQRVRPGATGSLNVAVCERCTGWYVRLYPVGHHTHVTGSAVHPSTPFLPHCAAPRHCHGGVTGTRAGSRQSKCSAGVSARCPRCASKSPPSTTQPKVLACLTCSLISLAGCTHADGIPLNREQYPVAPLGALHGDLSHLLGFKLCLIREG
jgi:hypothetical protein